MSFDVGAERRLRAQMLPSEQLMHDLEGALDLLRKLEAFRDRACELWPDSAPYVWQEICDLDAEPHAASIPDPDHAEWEAERAAAEQALRGHALSYKDPGGYRELLRAALEREKALEAAVAEHLLTIENRDDLIDARDHELDEAKAAIGEHVRKIVRYARERGHVQVKDRCPACGHENLFVGTGGWLTCSNLDCPNPGAAGDMLRGKPGYAASGTARAVLSGAPTTR